MFSHIVVSDLNESFGEDFKSIVRFSIFSAFVLSVDFFSDSFRKDSLTVEEVSVLDVKVDVSLAKCNQTYDEEDF